MKWVEPKLRVSSLAYVTVAILTMAVVVEAVLSQRNRPLRLEARRAMDQAVETLRGERRDKGLGFSKDDVGETGLIGAELTPLVTTLGSLRAKRAATDSSFAEFVVDLFLRAGVKRGDVIAVAFSGSLPGLNVAVLAASRALGLEPLIISSVGASTWGATDVDFTWLDMERGLNQRGIFPWRTLAASRGGGLGQNFLFAEGNALAGEAIERNGMRELRGDTLREAVGRYMETYVAAAGERPIKLFVNVGGAAVAVGACEDAKIDAGLVARVPPCEVERQGLIHAFRRRNVRVVHLLNVHELLMRYGVRPTRDQFDVRPDEG